ncbi:MAG: hypothetical protein K8T20_15990 [Planctomycetes bacterium]|nr:hypothetical protein [Planctomycetota bacterium]
MKLRMAGFVVALAVAGCGGDAPKKTDNSEAMEAYRSDCTAARTACERAADSAGMEKGTHGLARFLELWAADKKSKPPDGLQDHADVLRERFTELDVTLRASRALADGTQTDERTREALDAATRAIRNTVISVREHAAVVEPAIREFIKRDPQSDLAQKLYASIEDVNGTTLPSCETAARSLGSARDALKKVLDSSK